MAKQNEIPRSVAIVGRPNVGKSRLFNRLVGRRVSIVHDMPGVTRDLITERVPVDDYLLMDTGGIGLFTEDATPKVIADAVEEQVSFAIQAAELVILVTDVSQGCTPLDHEVATRLRSFGKKVLLVVNKVDNDERHMEQGDFFSLGFGAPTLISAEHNRGIEFLKRKILDEIGLAEVEEDEDGNPVKPDAGTPAPIRICLAGRPNVGKSSLGNALTKNSRLIVSDVAGTTRDPIKQRLDYTDKKTGETSTFELIDTAGKRAKNKFDTLEYFSALRTDEAMQRADVCFLVIDAVTGVTRLDKQLAGQIIEMGTGLIVVVNKWDLALKHFRTGTVSGYESEDEFRRAFAKAVNRELFFLPGSTVLFTSALEGLRVETMLKEARALYDRMNVQIPTGQLNRVIHGVMEANPPKMVSGRRFKCYYAVQTGNKPLRIRLFCNSEEKIDETYERFLLSKFYAAFELGGVPVKFDFVGKPKQERTFFMAQQTETVGGASTAKTRGNSRIVPPKKRTGAGVPSGKRGGKKPPFPRKKH
ncbi:MAG: ribosome biogenesis GTPase Der [Opitutales bacterium]|nr:ribosome biogenesis GTPase Der [Opitutales bacterium]